MSLFLGYDALERPVHLKPEQRKTHTHLIGSSGSGKSKFIEWLIRGDLKARQGFCLIDPHGTLYDEIASYCAHHVLRRDIILLNLSEPHAVVGFNPFSRAASGDVSVQVDRRIAATMHAWNVADADQTPTLRRTLSLIYTIMVEEGMTLPEVEPLIDFQEHGFRADRIERLQSGYIKREWELLQGLKRTDWQQETLSTRNRLGKFLTSQVLKRFMGLPDRTLNLTEIMDQGKILLVNLRPSDYLSEENQRVFGALLVNEFFECALRRKKDSGGQDPKSYYLYVDEFQNFVSLDIANMLDQVRKFGLFMVLAHQRFGQLDENVLEAALTNCGIKAVFGGLTVPNARCMAEELFIGKLDPKKIKAAIYQTKFWPTYSRDKVYMKGRGSTSSHGSMESSAFGSFSGGASGEFFQPGDWFGSQLAGSSSVSSFGSSHLSGRSSSYSDSYGETEAEIDIPIFVPVPFQELSSVQYYSLEEQLTELTAALKEQYPRHCFIKIHQQETQPMLVPFVKNQYTSPKNVELYRNTLLDKQDALLPAEVDRLIQERQTALLKETTPASTAIPATKNKQKEPINAGTRPEEKPAATRTKKQASDKTAWDDVIGKE